MIVTVTLSPALDKTAVVRDFGVGKVNRIESFRLDPGGKGINVSKTLRQLGCDSMATGILGGAAGEQIERSLTSLGIGFDFVHVQRETRTNLKVADPLRHTNTDINEPSASVDAAALEEVFRKACGHAGESGLVVLAGRAPGNCPGSLYADWTERFRTLGIRTCVDANGELLKSAAAAKPFLLRINGEELSSLTGAPMDSDARVADAVTALTAGGIGMVAVSLGARGAVFAKDGILLRGQGIDVPVQSTVGAGDAMMASLCAAEAWGMGIMEAAAFALAAGSAKVSCPGTQAPTLDQVRSLLPKARLEAIAKK